MSPRRAPSPPPLIKGYDYVSLIGSGGFSDVFLYQQQRPRRRVAIKVLLNEWSSKSQRAAFDAEADLMATLSTHPSIVTIYEADVASDGRPYLAMEYCPRPNLGARYRSERLTVAESLRIAVQIAGAVETAHQAGILHRDIKPSNILVTEYGHPALTDFGISSTLDDIIRAEGMSIPWSPPESFAEPPTSSIATDVWALAATVYTLLAGRSPFEIPGGSNSSMHLIERIESAPLLPTGRSDVPPTLERILATGLAKSPALRYPTVLEFARALQVVQNELSLDVTPIDLLDDSGHVMEEEAEEGIGTRLRQVVSIDPSGLGSGQRASSGSPSRGRSHDRGPTTSSGRARTASGKELSAMHAAVRDAAASAPSHAGAVPAPGGARGAPRPDTPTFRPPEAGASAPKERYRSGSWSAPMGETLVPLRADAGAGGAGGEERAPTPRRDVRRRLLVAVGVIAALVVAVLFATWVRGAAGGGQSPGGQEPTDGYVPGDTIVDLVPAVTRVTGVYDPATNRATFEWTVDPDKARPGDTFAYQVLSGMDEIPLRQTSDTRVQVDAGPTNHVCVEVYIVRDGRQSVRPTKQCAGLHGNTGADDSGDSGQ